MSRMHRLVHAVDVQILHALPGGSMVTLKLVNLKLDLPGSVLLADPGILADLRTC